MELTLVYDGGCLFCRAFALRAELKGGLPGLTIVDGRTNRTLRRELASRGFDLTHGAVLAQGQIYWHGSDAIAEISRRMQPSDPLLALLKTVFADNGRAKTLYPGLLAARRLALGLRGLPENPDRDRSTEA
jgi:predicted DCC family thiol-disulfide oxidoreductase YuxK